MVGRAADDRTGLNFLQSCQIETHGCGGLHVGGQAAPLKFYSLLPPIRAQCSGCQFPS
jgi:hypothetical protein